MPLQLRLHLEMDRPGYILVEYDDARKDFRVRGVSGSLVVAELQKHARTIWLLRESDKAWNNLDANDRPLESLGPDVKQRGKYLRLLDKLSIEMYHWIHTRRAPTGEVRLFLEGSSSGWVWKDTILWVEPVII